MSSSPTSPGQRHISIQIDAPARQNSNMTSPEGLSPVRAIGPRSMGGGGGIGIPNHHHRASRGNDDAEARERQRQQDIDSALSMCESTCSSVVDVLVAKG